MDLTIQLPRDPSACLFSRVFLPSCDGRRRRLAARKVQVPGTSFRFAEREHDGTPSQNSVEHNPDELGTPTDINPSLLLATRTPPQRRERETREEASKQQGRRAGRSLDGVTGRQRVPVSLPRVLNTERALVMDDCHATPQ